MEQKKVKRFVTIFAEQGQADDKCIGHQITEKLLKALVMDQLHLFIVRLSDKRKVLEELRKNRRYAKSCLPCKKVRL